VGKILQIQLMLIWLVGTLLGADPNFTFKMGTGSDEQVVTVNYDHYEQQTKQYRKRIEAGLLKKSLDWVNSYYDSALRPLYSEESNRVFKVFYQECAVLMSQYDTTKVDRSELPLDKMTKTDYTKWLKSESFICSSAIAVMNALRGVVRKNSEFISLLPGCLSCVDIKKIKMTIRADGVLLVSFDPEVHQQISKNMHIAAAYKDERVRRKERKIADACVVRQQELQSVQKSMEKMISFALSRVIDACEKQKEQVAMAQLCDDLIARESSFMQMSDALTQETESQKTEMFQFHSKFHLPHMQVYAALQHDKILQRERRQQLNACYTNRYKGWLANVAGIEQQRAAMVGRFFDSSVEMSSLLPVVVSVDSASQTDVSSKQLRNRNLVVGVLLHQVGTLTNKLTMQEQAQQQLVAQHQTDTRRLNTNLHAVTTQLNRKLRELDAKSTALDFAIMEKIGAQRDAVAAQYYRGQAEQNLDDVMLRERYADCPCCGAGLVAQNCEQECCPGGLAVTWYQ